MLPVAPNPFRGGCEVSFSVLQAGVHGVGWDGYDDDGLPLSGSVYFAAFKTRGVRISKRVTLVW